AAALQAADDRHRVVDRGAQRAQRRGVVYGLGQRVVDLRCLVADRPGQQQDRHDQRHDDQDDHDADRVAHDPAGGRRPGGEDLWPHDGSLSSAGFAEAASRLQARVDGGEPSRHGAGERGDRLHPAGGRDERLADGPQVEDHPEQAERGDRDDQRGDDYGCPGGCWHGDSPFQPRSLATEPAYRTAPTDTCLTVLSVMASPSGTPLSSPTSSTPPARMSSVAARIRSSAASTRLSRKITTGSTTSNRIALPIHYKTMARSPQLAVW